MIASRTTSAALCWEKPDDCVVIHLTLIPYLTAAGELKTKPTQHSVKALQESGVFPDVLVCRTEHEINDSIRRKLALFCNVQPDAVIQSIDAETIYDVPKLMKEEQLDKVAESDEEEEVEHDRDRDAEEHDLWLRSREVGNCAHDAAEEPADKLHLETAAWC